jgi:hypothetical protein
MQPRLALNLLSSCLHLSSAGNIGMRLGEGLLAVLYGKASHMAAREQECVNEEAQRENSPL